MIGKPRRNVLVSSEMGMMLVNRFDYNPETMFGVGQFILDKGIDCMVPAYIVSKYFTNISNPVIIDIGSNIGVFAIQAAQHIEQFGGFVYAFEPQEQPFYLNCANYALNNIDNARVERVAVGDTTTPITIPKLNYYQPSSFGSVGLTGEFEGDVGQELDFGNGDKVPQIIVDEYFKSIDNIVFIKVDVEGMEMNVLKGSIQTIKKHRPFLFVEYTKQTNNGKDLKDFIESMDYTIYPKHQDFICIPNERVDLKIEEILNEL
jgi:FkbM family methyltransferase